MADGRRMQQWKHSSGWTKHLCRTEIVAKRTCLCSSKWRIYCVCDRTFGIVWHHAVDNQSMDVFFSVLLYFFSAQAGCGQGAYVNLTADLVYTQCLVNIEIRCFSIYRVLIAWSINIFIAIRIDERCDDANGRTLFISLISSRFTFSLKTHESEKRILLHRPVESMDFVVANRNYIGKNG